MKSIQPKTAPDSSNQALAVAVVCLLNLTFLINVAYAQEISQELTSIDDAQTYQASANADALNHQVTTGSVPEDHESWWTCSIDSEPKVSQLHLRFWQTGEGFSGHHAMTWEAVSASAINITIGSNTFQLSDLLFSTGPDGNEYFLATDADQSRVECVWSGPRRDQVESTVQLDQGSHLLESQLIAGTNYTWSCTVNNGDGQLTEQQLQFNHNGIGVSDENDNFSWFVDSRFNVVLSFRDEVAVLRNIHFDSALEKDDTFEADKLAEHMSCSRSAV